MFSPCRSSGGRNRGLSETTMTQAQEDLAARVEKLEQGVEVAANLAKEMQALRVEVENREAWSNAAVADLQLGLTRLRIGAGGSVSFL
jgi:hypothetical protein